MRTFHSFKFTNISTYIGNGQETPVVSAIIGTKSYLFLVDTGASISIINHSAVKAAKLPTREIPPFKKNFVLYNRALINGKNLGTTVHSFKLGTLSSPLYFQVVPDEIMEFITGNTPKFVGIVGADFLNKFATHYDFVERKIDLLPQGFVTRMELTKLGFAKSVKSFSLFPMRNKRHMFLVGALCNRNVVQLLLDTASASIRIYGPPAKFGVKPEELREEYGMQFGGIQKGRSADALVSVGDIPQMISRVTFRDERWDMGDGILGVDYLSKFRLLIDPPAKKIFLQPNNM